MSLVSCYPALAKLLGRAVGDEDEDNDNDNDNDNDDDDDDDDDDDMAQIYVRPQPHAFCTASKKLTQVQRALDTANAKAENAYGAG